MYSTHSVYKKCAKSFLTVALEVVNKFPSNLAYSIVINT